MTPKEKTKVLSTRVVESFYEKIDELAKKERRKITDMVRILIEDGLKEKNNN
jgi:predicted DNA-binding protein